MNKTLYSLLLTILAAPVWGDCDFTDFPTMAEMKISVLMDDANYNNRPIMARSFSANTTAGSLVSFYQRAWKDRSAESVFGPWQQISTVEDNCLFTVQYGEAGEGVFGRLLISVAPGADADVPMGEGVIKPGDAQVVSDLKTRDGHKNGRVTVITSERSVSELMTFYRTEMLMDGWSLDNNFAEQGRSVMTFRRRADEVHVLITPAGEASQILINEVLN